MIWGCLLFILSIVKKYTAGRIKMYLTVFLFSLNDDVLLSFSHVLPTYSFLVTPG